jgi:hypothetical protein
MTKLTAFIDSVGLIGPGFNDWPTAQALLAGERDYEAARTVIPAPACLPAAERRRTGAGVKLALAAGLEAAAASGRDAGTLAAVFTASGGDGTNCHAICETLAAEDPQDRKLSPTRFHNSVHNAPAGYWSIATRAMAPSNVLCAFDGSLGAGLLESLCQVSIDGVPNLLIAFDTDYPQPMREKRPVPDSFGFATVLAPEASGRSIARIDAALTDAPVTQLAHAGFEAMRREIPTARVLPLLDALATKRAATVVLDYLPEVRIELRITLPGANGGFTS